MAYQPPNAPGAPDRTTNGDDINAAQKGRTGTGFDPEYVAQPWDRGFQVLENEPVTSLADSGMPWSDNSWVTTTIGSSKAGTITAGPGTAGTLGTWPISGTEIHGRGAQYQSEKDLGPGGSRQTPPGFGGD